MCELLLLQIPTICIPIVIAVVDTSYVFVKIYIYSYHGLKITAPIVHIYLYNALFAICQNYSHMIYCDKFSYSM